MPKSIPYIVLAIGVAITALASILIRFAQNAGLPSLIIATCRVLLASLLLTPLAWGRYGEQLREMKARDRWLIIASGLLLGLHLYSWIASIGFTSVASSVALVSTHPLWVGLASVFLLREKLKLGSWLGILLTLLGSLLIAYSDGTNAQSSGSAPLLGSGLALMGAITAAGYFLLGRTVRKRVVIIPYIWLAYSSAALTLLIIAVLSGQINSSLLHFPWQGWLFVVGLTLGPQLLSHSAFNWVLRYLSPALVTVAILGEPIGSAILALFFFKETFLPLQSLGFSVILLGVLIAALAERSEK
jgi:drug/metabolite transporter (DMT)-like permease